MNAPATAAPDPDDFHPLPFPAAAVDVLHAPPDTAFLDRYQPAVIEGWLDGWPLFHDISGRRGPRQQLARLARVAPDRRVEYTVLPADGRLCYKRGTIEPDFQFNAQVDTFAGLLSRLQTAADGAGPGIYMQSTPIVPDLPEFAPLLGPLSFRRRQVQSGRMWLGSGSQVVQLHYDTSSNYMCLLMGRKRVTMFPPTALASLYPAPPDRGLVFAPCSLVDLVQPDLSMFPKLQQALSDARSVVLEPGQVLHIPPYWWHHVESVGVNLMINFWQPDLSPRMRRILSRCLDDLLLDERALAPGCRSLFHGRLCAEMQALESPAEERAAPVGNDALDGEARAHIAQFTDVLAFCPQYWRSVYAELARHYTDADPFPTLPGEWEALVARIASRRSDGQELDCF